MFNLSRLISIIQEHLPGANLFLKVAWFLKAFYLYLAFIGIFGFALFIAEETQQINAWAIFAAKDANRTDLILKNCQVIEDINIISKRINKYFMWMNPFQQWSYNALNEGIDVYLETQRAYVLATSPELFIGQTVKIDFKYDSYTPGKNGLYVLKNKKVKVITNKLPNNMVINITGKVLPDPEILNGVIIISELN